MRENLKRTSFSQEVRNAHNQRILLSSITMNEKLSNVVLGLAEMTCKMPL